MEALGEGLSRERQIDTAIKQRLYMSPAGTPREVRASTEGHDVFVQQMASWVLGGTELMPRFCGSARDSPVVLAGIRGESKRLMRLIC
jgi:hypothetical protein